MSNTPKASKTINLGKPNHGKGLPRIKGLSPKAQQMIDEGLLVYKNGMIRPKAAEAKVELSQKQIDSYAKEFRLKRVRVSAAPSELTADQAQGEVLEYAVEVTDKSGLWFTHLIMTDFWQELLGLEGVCYVIGYPLPESLGILEVLPNKGW